MSFVILLQKDSYFDDGDTDAIFLFLPQTDFYICPRIFFVFFFFLLQKYLGTYDALLFEPFLCFFL